MSNLRNPGPEVPKILDFDTIPSLKEFFAHGGVPGVEYLFVTPKNQPRAQQEGWLAILGVPFFKVAGQDCTIMGRGKPIRNSPAMPGTGLCKVFADGDLLEAGATALVEVESAPVATTPPNPDLSRKSNPKHTPTSSSLLR